MPVEASTSARHSLRCSVVCDKALGVGILKPVRSQVIAACGPDPRSGATEFIFSILFVALLGFHASLLWSSSSLLE